MTTCPPSFIGGNDGCDCECDVPDPDCKTQADILFNCPAGTVTCIDNVCLNETEIAERVIPPEWTCSPNFYDANDGCDCECGAPDPDCDKENQELFGCSAENVCVLGECVEQCLPENFNVLDGCHCGCGQVDPDCKTQLVVNCPTNTVCVKDECVVEIVGDRVPLEWTCSPTFYVGNDGCDCNCGAPDPDCESTPVVFGCDGETDVCELGICIGNPTVTPTDAPSQTAVPEELYITTISALSITVFLLLAIAFHCYCRTWFTKRGKPEVQPEEKTLPVQSTSL